MGLIAQHKDENEAKQGGAGKANAKAGAKHNVIDEDDGEEDEEQYDDEGDEGEEDEEEEEDS